MRRGATEDVDYSPNTVIVYQDMTAQLRVRLGEKSLPESSSKAYTV